MTVFYRMRRRISAATLPCTSRNYPRIQVRIPSLNRKSCERLFLFRTTCAMAREKYLPQGFLSALGFGSLA
jgi:hypothetical protein